MSITRFMINFEQTITASRSDAAAIRTIRLSVRSSVDAGDSGSTLYSLALSAASDHPDLRLERSMWVGETPIMALDLALSFFALFLRSKQSDGWQIHPTVAELERAAREHHLDTAALASTLAGSTLLGSVASDTAVLTR